jgi:hypothetical protein
MRYLAPFGSADPNASYVDRNTPGATKGSAVPGAAVEHTQREIVAVITAAGLTPSGADLTQLEQAIREIISQITGAGDTSTFVTMAAARGRLPIFPEVLTADGRIPVISPSAGQVRVPAGYDFLHRGIFNVTTVQEDFATAANKTYHLRWTPSDGFVLNDLADTDYNPASAAEASAAFDSTFDDAFFCKVVTNGANVPTIVNLANKDRLFVDAVIEGTNYQATNANLARCDLSLTYNLARTPRTKALQPLRTYASSDPGTTDRDMHIYQQGIAPAQANPAFINADRYRLAATYLLDGMTNLAAQFTAQA